jgi:hypothetical protein
LGAVVLDASATLGIHVEQIQVSHTLLDASAVHAEQFQVSHTVLDASASLGTHSEQIQVSHTVLDASAALGTHAWHLGASLLDASATLGTHSVTSGTPVYHTLLDASATLGTHSVFTGSVPHTLLDASATLGTHGGSQELGLIPSVSLLGDGTWQLTWEVGTPPYTIWLEGLVIAEGLTTESYIISEPGWETTPPPVEIEGS